MPALGKMLDDILSYTFQTVITSNELILPTKLALKLFLLGFVQFSFFKETFYILFEVRIDKLDFRNAILII